jgi:adenylate kinase family enzyme
MGRLRFFRMSAAVSGSRSVGKRIQVIGAIGSGKSTTGRCIAQRLDLLFIDLDSIRHGPNWVDKPDKEFKSEVLGKMSKATEGWVVAGNYFQSLDLSVISCADTIVWLRIPFRATFPRLLWRTFRRAWTQEELWNGNRETWRQSFLSRESVLIEALVKASGRQKREDAVLKQLSNQPTIIELTRYKQINLFLQMLATSRCHL